MTPLESEKRKIGFKGVEGKELTVFKLHADNADTTDELPTHFYEFTWDNQSNAMHRMISVVHDRKRVLNLTATAPENWSGRTFLYN